MSKDWKLYKLNEAYIVKDGTHDSPKYVDVGYPLITSKNLKNGYLIYDKVKYISEEDYKNINKRSKVDQGDLLFAMIGTIGNPVIINHTPKFAIKNVALFKKKDNSIDFLKYFLSSKNVVDKMKTDAKGATQKFVSLGYLRDFQIPLPPLEEQQKIVEKLDKAFELIDQAKANIEQNISNAKELFQSKLNQFFTESKNDWDIDELINISKFIDYRGRTPVKTKSGIRLITAKNVKLGYLNIQPQEFIAEDDYEGWMTRGIPNFGDIIFTTEAPLANVAQINLKEKLAFAQRIIVIQPYVSIIYQDFLKYSLISKVIRDNILSKATGATVQGIKSSLLKKVLINYPKSLIEQKRIIEILDRLQINTNRLINEYELKLSNLEELRKSILEKAFKGELTH